MDWKYKFYRHYRKSKNIIAANWFKEKGYDVQHKYPFILDKKDNWVNNIILDTVYGFIQAERKIALDNNNPFPIHDYIHHGLSSQAMLFNLLGDVVMKKDIKTLSEIFDFKNVQIKNDSIIKFEHCNRDTFNEKQQQPTSMDFVILNKEGENIFLESKLVETEFGNCSTIKQGECDGQNPIDNPSMCYLTFKGRKYWELMKKYDLHKSYANSPICPLSIYYQFFRELIFSIENKGYYVILIDKENPSFIKGESGFERGLIPTLTKSLPLQIKSKIKIIYIQDVLSILEKNRYIWVKEFRNKYGI